MSAIGKIEKRTGSKFLSYYEMEAIHRDGSVSPYYMASRISDPTKLKAVTQRNDPDGVILCGVYGENKDRIVLIRQFRYPIGGYVYELPAGLVEPGEDLLQSGMREMYEETGPGAAAVGNARGYCGLYGVPGPVGGPAGRTGAGTGPGNL